MAKTKVPKITFNQATLTRLFNWSIGLFLASILYGILLVLAMISIILLGRSIRRQNGSGSGARSGGAIDRSGLSRSRILLYFVITLLLGNTIAIIGLYINCMSPIISTAVTTKLPSNFDYTVNDLIIIPLLIVVLMADGLMVWRCYMVQKVVSSGRGSIWMKRITMSILTILWLVTFTTGLATIAFRNKLPTPTTILTSYRIGATTLTSNVLLNIFATTFIITRLLQQRRLIISSFGNVNVPGTQQTIRTVEILLESAVMNIPVTIVALVGAAKAEFFGNVTMVIASICQSLASVAVICYVAIGRAIGERERDKIKTIETLSPTISIESEMQSEPLTPITPRRRNTTRIH